MAKKSGYHWKLRKHRPGEDLWYGAVQMGGVSPNCHENVYGSPDEGWFWWAMGVGGDDWEWNHFGLFLPRSMNANLKLPRKQDAKDELMTYCRKHLKTKGKERAVL